MKNVISDHAEPLIGDIKGEQAAASIAQLRTEIDDRLARLIPDMRVSPSRLHQAMAHTLLKPGKRYRPLLTVIIAQGFGVDNGSLYDIAAAAEMVHASSLIFDDLPCMDDAELRRNAPCAHVKFDESTAILAATALLNLSFGVLAEAETLTAEQRVSLCALLSRHVGSDGLIAGQMMDLMNTDSSASVNEVEHLNRLKTGALISYSVEAACIIASVSAEKRVHLSRFADELGLAYQLMDDVKDQIFSQEEAEKDTGKDAGKSTILALRGLAYARQKIDGHVNLAKSHLEKAGLGEERRLHVLLEQQFSALRQTPTPG